MSLTLTDYLLWVTGEILLVMACAAILRRRLVNQFPVFFAYAAFHVLRTAVLFTIHLLELHHRTSYADYFYAYWTTQAVSIVLGFAVIYAIYCGVFQHYDALQKLGGILFGCAGVALLILALWTAASAAGAETPGIVRAVLLLERRVRLMQCGLVLFLFLAAFYFGLPWQNYRFGIALGFGVFASIELAAVAVRSHMGASVAAACSQINSAAYSSGVMIWLCYLLAPKPALQYAGVVQHNDLEKWNQALLEILER
jgi:hypothetical protein